jgi:protein-L-isoaspartate(D-aspartate) O-methyltransferase
VTRVPAGRELAAARDKMVHDQLLRRGISDERVLQAMARVARERFVAPELAGEAYADHPLAIGFGQTISQPYVVARIAELLELTGSERVLDVGAGSGYQAAVLAELAGAVYAVERIAELAASAEQRLRELGYPIAVSCQDGSSGWPAHAPYDAIAVAAGAPAVPAPLFAQLRDGGRLVLPLGPVDNQRLTVVRRRGSELTLTGDLRVRFVPLLGEHGFPD